MTTRKDKTWVNELMEMFWSLIYGIAFFACVVTGLAAYIGYLLVFHL